MALDPRLVDLLLRYEEMEEQGQPAKPEELCRDCPELLGAFKRELEGLRQVNARLATAPRGPGPGVPGPNVPGYEVLKELGRGGMGVVYLARQVALNRLVALKMVLAGEYATASELARFRQEAEVLGRLRHPNIVPIYEVGECAGRPYFALEYLEGGSLARWLAGGRQAAARQSAELVETLAQAMHAAHEQGIVHRDLKPANVLLAASGVAFAPRGSATPGADQEKTQDASATPLAGFVPKISDFGLAKEVGGAGPTPSSGAVLGTPSYMAPEQAAGKSKRVGPAVDVYSLGAILYELLTGRPPFQGENAVDVLVQVVSCEPVSPALLRSGLARDLAVICLKCLQKQPHKRYGSAVDLADDLRRFLEGRPIHARPVGRAERAWRWCRRQPLAASLLTGLLVVFLGGFAAVTWKWREADQERGLAIAQRDRAENVLQAALDTNIAVGDLAEQLKPLAGTQSTTVARILRLAARNYERLLQEGGETPALLEGKARMLNAFSEVYVELGDTTQARAAAEEAQRVFAGLIQRQPDNARWQAGLATSLERIGIVARLQGRLGPCLAAHEESLAIRQRLVELYPAESAYRMDLSTSQVLVGDFHIDKRRDIVRARQAYDKSLAIREQLAKEDPKNQKWQAALAFSQAKVGHVFVARYQHQQALPAYMRSLAIYDRLTRQDKTNAQWQLWAANVRTWIGNVHQELGNLDLARLSLEQALNSTETLARSNPTNAEWQRQVMDCRWELANLKKRDNPVLALQEQLVTVRQLEALAIHRAGKDRHNANWQGQVARAKWLRGLDLAGLAAHGVAPTANYAEASTVLQEALALQTALLKREPADYRSLLNLSNIYATLGMVRSGQGQHDAAWTLRVKGISVLLEYFEAWAVREPAHPSWQVELAQRWAHLANAYFLQRKPRDALAAYRNAVACYERLRKLEPNNNHWLRELAETLSWVGTALEQQALAATDALLKSPEYAESLVVFRRSVKLFEELVEREPKNAAWRREVADAYYWLAGKLGSRGDLRGEQTFFVRYLDSLEKSFALDAKAAAIDPLNPSKSLSTSGAAGEALHAHLFELRNGVRLSERRMRYFERPYRDQNFIDSYVKLIRSLDLSRKDEAREARWALRRGLGFLRRRQAENKLHQVQERLIPFFEAALRKRPANKPPESLDATAQQALEGLDYRRLAEHLLQLKRPRDLVLLLAREAAEADKVPWVKEMVREVAAAALVLRPDFLAAVLDTARRMVKEEAKALPAEGRALLAYLARHAGDPDMAALLDPGSLEAPLDRDLLNVHYVKLCQAGYDDAATRVLEYQIRTSADRGKPAEYQGLAELHLRAGRVEQAAETIAKLAKRAPEDLETQRLQGWLYTLQRRFPQARDQWRKVMAHPRVPSESFRTNLHPWLAGAHAELGQWSDAERELKRALQADPNNVTALDGLAQVYAEQNKNLKQAEAMVRKALATQPQSPWFVSELGWILSLQKQVPQGLRMMETVAASPALAGSLVFFDRLGDVYHLHGQADKARQAWRKALSLFPKTTAPDDRRRAATRRKLESLPGGD
jgi:serine/threonine protein kinase/tetratricopeptide (TPR) repeat protein